MSVHKKQKSGCLLCIASIFYWHVNQIRQVKNFAAIPWATCDITYMKFFQMLVYFDQCFGLGLLYNHFWVLMLLFFFSSSVGSNIWNPLLVATYDNIGLQNIMFSIILVRHSIAVNPGTAVFPIKSLWKIEIVWFLVCWWIITQQLATHEIWARVGSWTHFVMMSWH